MNRRLLHTSFTEQFILSHCLQINGGVSLLQSCYLHNLNEMQYKEKRHTTAAARSFGNRSPPFLKLWDGIEHKFPLHLTMGWGRCSEGGSVRLEQRRVVGPRSSCPPYESYCQRNLGLSRSPPNGTGSFVEQGKGSQRFENVSAEL